MNTRFTRVSLLGLLLLAPCGLAPSPATAQSIYIGDANTAQVVRYNIQTGANEGIFTSGHDFSFIAGLAFGANGSLYTGDFDLFEVAQFDAHTGVYQRTISSFNGGQGLLAGPNGILYEVDSYAVGHFDENGHFVVDDPFRGHILGFDAQTGAPTSDYRGPVGGEFGLLILGPDHNFYVGDLGMQQVLSFDGVTGAPRGAFTSGGDLQDPFGLAFGPDANLYVVSRASHQVLRYNGTTGAYLGVFASGPGLDFADWAVFGPDANLYVTDFGSNQVSRFDGITGAYDIFAPGVGGPLAFAPMQWSGVLRPINADGTSTFRLGATVPVKFALTGADASNSTIVPRLFVAPVSGDAVGAERVALATSNANTGNRFRYSDGQYIFNLSTSGLAAGTWRLRIDLGDGVERTVLIGLRG